MRRLRTVAAVMVIVGVPVGVYETVTSITDARRDDLVSVQREADARIADVKAEDAANIARVKTEADARAYSQCLTGNDFRTNDLATWLYLLGPNPPVGTDAQRAAVAKFRAFIVHKDALRICVKPKPAK